VLVGALGNDDGSVSNKQRFRGPSLWRSFKCSYNVLPVKVDATLVVPLDCGGV
jgi:hypothetical protein